MSENKIIKMEILSFIKYKDECYEVGALIKELLNTLDEKNDEIERLNNIIKEAKEYIENGCDFKSIYFKETDSDLWKIFMKDDIKNDLLKILKGEQ